MYRSIKVIDTSLEVDQEYSNLKRACDKSGAIVFFVGLVRDFYDANSPDKIESLHLEHYQGFTEALLAEIVDQAESKWPLDGVSVIHRVGEIFAAQEIVMVAVASAHRYDAFQASQFIMDYLKTRAAIWKKQVGERGDDWVEQKQSDLDHAEQWSDLG